MTCRLTFCMSTFWLNSGGNLVARRSLESTVAAMTASSWTQRCLAELASLMFLVWLLLAEQKWLSEGSCWKVRVGKTLEHDTRNGPKMRGFVASFGWCSISRADWSWLLSFAVLSCAARRIGY